MTRFIRLAAAAVVFWTGLASGAARRPNVVVILADDMGFSDVGCYGSEISTPNIDALASGGVRFNQFYNTARCCPTRAALMTGLYPHQAGMGHMVGGPTGPGYQGTLSKETPTIPEVLKEAGYATYMAGKWHLTSKTGLGPVNPRDTWPMGRGFERYYGTVTGGGSYWDPQMLTRDQTPISPLADPEYKPEGRFYYTTAIAENAARFVREHKGRTGDKPFFMYVAFTAPHWPLNAPEDAVAKYKGKYDAGYKAIREARFARQKEMGVVKSDWVMSDPAGDWDAVKNKAWETRCMEVYAAQVELMDAGVGKVVAALKDAGEFDDTVVIFMSDNGGCAENTGRTATAAPAKGRVLKADEVQTQLRPAFTRDGEEMKDGPAVMPGPPGTFIAYGQGWANVSNTPFREYKHWVHEGGISSPLVVNWPNGMKRHGEWEGQVGCVEDVMATCVDLAGAKGPPRTEGVSLVPAFRGEHVERPNPIFWEHEGNRAVREGKWKLVAKGEKGAWELYDVEADRGETRDLAAAEPDRVKELAAAWQAWAERSQVLPMRPYAKKAAGE